MSVTKQTLLFIGGTGAQGSAIIHVLATTSRYHIIVPTRNTTSRNAQALSALPDVEVVPSQAEHAFNEQAFLEQARRSDAVFINTDGFSLGEALEVFWGIRLFELSVHTGVKHVIYSGLDNNGQKTNFNPKLYAGHYEGKARVQEWIHAFGDHPTTAWTIIRSGPYAEMLSGTNSPHIDPASGTVRFQLPLGPTGEMPWVSLTDFGRYVDWALTHPAESRSLDFGIAIEHAGLARLAEAYTAATGKPATWADGDLEEWLDMVFGPGKNVKVGSRPGSETADLLHLTFRENFTAWFELYKVRVGNKGLITRDYEFLDRILPDRYRTMEEWMRGTGYTGEKVFELKGNGEYRRA